jgi:hypothetical protein
MTSPQSALPVLVGDPSQRLVLADQIAAALVVASPESSVSLRGSLASGHADSYSDIDLAWTVPDVRFGAAVGSVVTALASVAPVVSFRSDPDHQRSLRRRLLFVRFAGVPLFWRLDLELWTASAAFDASIDDDPSMRGEDWCPYESALMNALGAIKTVLRGQPEVAEQGLTRGFERVGTDPRVELSTRRRVIELTEAVAAARPHLRTFATDIAAAAAQELR